MALRVGRGMPGFLVGMKQGCDGAEGGDEHVHVRREVEEAMPEAEEDAVGAEVGGGVVAEVLGVAEDVAGAGVVVGVPDDERQDGDDEGDGPVAVGSGLEAEAVVADELEGFPGGKGEGGDNGGLFGESGEGEESCGPELGGEEIGGSVVGWIWGEVEGDAPRG